MGCFGGWFVGGDVDFVRYVVLFDFDEFVVNLFEFFVGYG